MTVSVRRTPLWLAVVFAIISSVLLIGTFAFSAMMLMAGFNGADESASTPAVITFFVMFFIALTGHNFLVITVSKRFTPVATFVMAICQALFACQCTFTVTALVGFMGLSFTR